MTLLEAANLVLPNCKVTSAADLTMEQKMLLVRCFNAAIQEFYQLAPDIYKRTKATHTLLAPASLTGLSIASGSTTNTGTAFAASLRGQSIYTAAGWNEIVSETQALRANPTATTITEATVYHDTVVLWGTAVERQVGKVWCVEGDKRWAMERVDAPEGVVRDSSPFLSALQSGWVFDRTERYVGDVPRYFGVQAVGQSHAGGANDAAFMLRINPVPTRAFTIELLVDFLAINLNPYSLQDGTELPVPAERVHSLLLPLVEARLAATKLWDAPAATAMVVAEASQARLNIRMLPAHFSPPSIPIGRAKGF
jgi:hypothetical protein